MAYHSKTARRGAFPGASSGRAREAGVSLFEQEVTGLSVDDAIDHFLQTVDWGSARDRHGRRFAPEAVGELHWSLGGHVREELGRTRLIDMRRDDVEALVYQLSDAGVSHRRLRAVANSVRALYDDAIERGLVQHNPAERVALPDDGEGVAPARPTKTISGRAISLGLQLATIGFALIALQSIAESL